MGLLHQQRHVLERTVNVQVARVPAPFAEMGDPLECDGCLFGIVLAATVYRGIDRAQGGGLLDAALITFFWAADTLPHLLAMSLLIATVLTFARASQDREITALRAAGISPRVPVVAAMLVGIVYPSVSWISPMLSRISSALGLAPLPKALPSHSPMKMRAKRPPPTS